MKNVFASVIALSLLVIILMGCGFGNPLSSKEEKTTNSNKTLTDKGIDTVVGEETTGVPECDEALNLIAEELNNPDDGYIVKAGKALVLNKIKETIKTAIEENKKNNNNSNAELVKTCTDMKKQIIKAKEEQQNK